MNQEIIYSLIAGIYDAALDAGRWPKVLEQIGRALDSTAVNITVMDGLGLPRLFFASGIPAELHSLFLHKYTRMDLNPMAALAVSLPTGALHKSWESPGLVSFAETEMYDELYLPLGVFNGIGSILARSSEYNVGFGVLVPQERSELTEAEVNTTRIILPHLQRALQVFLRLQYAQQESRHLCDALDSVSSVGVVLVDATGAVILANSRAQEIARQHDGFTMGPNGVKAATLDLTSQLEKAIGAAVHTGADNGLSAGGTLRLGRPSGRRPLLAVVSPVGTAEWTLLPLRPAAIVLICDPERELLLPPDRLSQLFRLTRREAQIAALLAHGADLSEIAERLGVSRGTVHTHLKRILEKTDTHRQAELVSLLLRGLAGLGH